MKRGGPAKRVTGPSLGARPIFRGFLNPFNRERPLRPLGGLRGNPPIKALNTLQKRPPTDPKKKGPRAKINFRGFFAVTPIRLYTFVPLISQGPLPDRYDKKVKIKQKGVERV